MSNDLVERAKARSKGSPPETRAPAVKKEKPKEAPTNADGSNPRSGDARNVVAYYDMFRGSFWVPNRFNEYQPYSQEFIKIMLRSHGFSKELELPNGLTMLEDKLLKMSDEYPVHYAGPLAGFAPGVYDISSKRILVTSGPKLIKPKRGRWPTLGKFLAELLGDQRKYLAAWLRWALQSLRQGPPWSAGQMLAIAGPAGCGKSLLQQLITQMLGGRSAKPYRYMIGETQFNSELFGAEHLMIEDEPSSSDLRTRRHFGAQVKNLTVCKDQSLHAKGRNAITLQPYMRITITLNDEPESLMVLPPMDEDLKDKVLLLKASPVAFPFPSKRFPDSQHYWKQLVAELPEFLYYLRTWAIPESLRDQRFGVRAWQNPDLLHAVDSLSPETKLWSLIETLGLLECHDGAWSGTSSELERELRTRDRSDEVPRLLSFSTACGVYLGRLRGKMPKNVLSRKGKGNSTIWTLLKLSV